MRKGDDILIAPFPDLCLLVPFRAAYVRVALKDSVCRMKFILGTCGFPSNFDFTYVVYI